MKKPNPYLVCSSVMFIIPATMGAYYRQWNIYFTFIFITLISSLYHSTKNRYLIIIDYAACYNIVYVLYRQSAAINQLLNFSIWCGVCAVIFWGGYLTNRFIFSPNMIEKNITHVSMHLIVIGSGCAVSYLTNKHQLLENES